MTERRERKQRTRAREYRRIRIKRLRGWHGKWMLRGYLALYRQTAALLASIRYIE